MVQVRIVTSPYDNEYSKSTRRSTVNALSLGTDAATVSYAQLIAVEERNKQIDEFRRQLSDIVSRLAALEA